MKEVTTTSGFTAKVNENTADDIAFLDLICELDDGDPHAIRKLIDKILCAEDKEKLFDHVRTEDGRVPVSAINAELTDIIKALGKK